MSTDFRDLFSQQSPEYRSFRPGYPRRLFQELAALAPARQLAWDCATGNGQAACGLAEHFHRVIATDASARQIANARPHSGVAYRVAPAERSGIPDRSIDLICVAQALHWFDHERFYAEARRVLRPRGILAVWTYNLFQITPEIDTVIRTLYRELLGPYWPAERRLVEQGYRELSFPFEELPAIANCSMQQDWNLEHVMGYLATWSAVQAYRSARGSDPLDRFREGLTRAWGSPERRRRVSWPLAVRVGVHGSAAAEPIANPVQRLENG